MADSSLLPLTEPIRKMVASKHHCSPDLNRVGREFLGDVETLEKAFRQACTNLATIRPTGKDQSLAEDAEDWMRALMRGDGGPE